MVKFLTEMIDWSEVWASLIPLIIYLWVRPTAAWVKPLLAYLVIAFLLSVVIDITWKSVELGIEDWCKKTFWWLYRGEYLYTLVFYNANSFLRLLLFTWFFYLVNPKYQKTYVIITTLFIAGGVANFAFSENIILTFSSRLFTIEAAIILFYCLLYYYAAIMNDEIKSLFSLPPFWIVMGLTLYASVNFLIFLFYKYLIVAERNYAIDVWNVHNGIYIVLMIFIGVALKKAR